MDVSTLLDGLNDKQRDAVAWPPLQPAGALAEVPVPGKHPGAGAPYRLAGCRWNAVHRLHHRGDLY